MSDRDDRSRDFEAAALPFIADVARFALHLTREESEVDDLVQETFLRAFSGWHTFSAGTDCRRWLYTICRNAFLRLQQKRHRLVLSEDGDLDGMPAVLSHVAATRGGLGDLFDRIDVRPAIAQAVADLPEPHHTIIVLDSISAAAPLARSSSRAASAAV